MEPCAHQYRAPLSRDPNLQGLDSPRHVGDQRDEEQHDENEE
jgi:hypothetical protein